MTFYNYDGNIISVEEFVELYSSVYYIGNAKVEGIIHTQTSKYVEEKEILPILYGHIDSYQKLAKILAWKLGKIKQRESEDQSKIVYASDWQNCEFDNPLLFNKEFNLKELYNYIKKNLAELEELAISNPQECLLRLRDASVSGIGTVYLITLLFFLSHGKYPIYDRFAMAALLAAEGDIAPTSKSNIIVKEPPTKDTAKFAKICENEYGKYIMKLQSLGLDYQNDRRVDRALWVYGHAFNKKCF